MMPEKAQAPAGNRGGAGRRDVDHNLRVAKNTNSISPAADAATVRYHRKYLMLWPSVSLVEELRTLDAIEAMAGFDNDDYEPEVVENSAIETASVRQAILEILDYRERHGVEVPEPTYGIPHETIEVVKQRRPVEAEIELSTDLRRAGVSLRGVCPICPGRSNPSSLSVWPDNGRWKCFRCSIGGDVIDWVIAHQRWEFPQAVRYLAGVTGVSMEPAQPVSGKLRGGFRHAG